MKKAKFSDSQIMSILKQAAAGTPVAEVLREHGIASATFYKWRSFVVFFSMARDRRNCPRSRYGGMDLPMMTRLKELEQENSRLKKMYADERLKADILKEVLEKK